MPARRHNPAAFLGEVATRAAVQAVVVAAAQQYGVDPNLALAIAQRESGFNPNAVSPKGAKGVMQLVDSTAAMLGVTDPFNVVQNVYGGVRYIAQLIQQFGGDVAKAVAAYNVGPGRVTSAVAQYAGNWLAAVPAETQAYVAALLGVTPQPATPAPPGAPEGTYTTIDAATGQVVDDDTPTPAPAGNPLASLTPTNALLLAGLAAAAWFAADLLSD